MEMEDKESTETGSLGGNSEIESPPPVSSVAGGGGGVVPPVVSMPVDVSMENSAGVVQPAGGVVGAAGVVVGGGGFSGAGSGDTVVKKKRGRPRKYDADGNLRVKYIASPPSGGGGTVQSSPGFGFSFSSPSSGEFSSTKRGRGRPPGSGNWQLLASLGELFASTTGTDFTPHVVTVHAGEDVAGKIHSMAHKGPRGLCILSANGTISNVTIRQPGSSGGLLTFEGRFEILSLTGTFVITDNGGMKTKTGTLSVSLAGPDGRVVGGGVAGVLLAATPIQIVIGSFMPIYKTHKRKHHFEERTAPAVHTGPPHATAAATPTSQAAQASNVSPTPASQMPVQPHGEADHSASNKDNPNSTSTDSAEYNNSGPAFDQSPYPDINVSIPME